MTTAYGEHKNVEIYNRIRIRQDRVLSILRISEKVLIHSDSHLEFVTSLITNARCSRMKYASIGNNGLFCEMQHR